MNEDAALALLEGILKHDRERDISNHEELRVDLTWGTYGEYGDDPIKYLQISEMSKEHINACLDTQRMSRQYRNVMNHELIYRESIK